MRTRLRIAPFLCTPLLLVLLAGCDAKDAHLVSSSGDTYVSAAAPTQNFSGASTLGVKKDSVQGAQKIALMNFKPASAGVADFDLVGAILRVYVSTSNGQTVPALRLFTTTSFSASTVTWNGLPTKSQFVRASNPTASGTWINFNVTDQVRAALLAAQGVYFEIRTATPGIDIGIASRESSGHGPGLLVIADGQPGTTVPNTTTTLPGTTTTAAPPTTTTSVPPSTTTSAPPTTTTVPSGGWPNASNTGPRIAITNVINGDYNTASDGQTISGTEIKGRLVIKNANVTVTDSIVRGDTDAGGGNGWFGIQNEDNHPGLVVQYSEIGKSAAGTLDVGVQAGDATVTHSNIHSSDGIQASGGTTLTDNYIHNLYAANQSGPNQSHMDGIQMFSGPGKTTITHNWIDCTDHSPAHLLPNGSIFFQGTYNNELVSNNHLEGGGYLFRLEAGGNGATVTNNHFRVTDGRGWGDSLVQGQIVAQSGNMDDVTGKPITL